MRTLRWGVVSTAKIATEKVIPGLVEAPNCEVTAIASRDEATARAAAQRLGILRAYGEYATLLADDDVDAVYVPLPNHLHATWAIAAAQAGKHVLCEKPLALTSSDAARMVEAAEAAGVRFMEAFMYRLHPSWEKVRELVAAGAVGELRGIHTWFSYYNDDPANIRNQAAAGGGALMDIGCYAINLSRMLCDAEPDEVTGALVVDPDLDVDTTTSGLLRFGSVTSAFTCSMRAKPDQYVTVHGTDGRIAVDVPFNIPPDRPTTVRLWHGTALPAYAEPETFEFPPQSPYTVQAERLADAVLDGTDLPIPPDDGVANMRALERVTAASK